MVITAKYYNITVSSGMPLTLACSSRCMPGFCQVMWTANKSSAEMLVSNDNEHVIWSTPPYKDVQTHYLNVNSASTSTSYNCSLVTITGRIADSAQQSVYVKESGEYSYWPTYSILQTSPTTQMGETATMQECLLVI